MLSCPFFMGVLKTILQLHRIFAGKLAISLILLHIANAACDTA